MKLEKYICCLKRYVTVVNPLKVSTVKTNRMRESLFCTAWNDPMLVQEADSYMVTSKLPWFCKKSFLGCDHQDIFLFVCFYTWQWLQAEDQSFCAQCPAAPSLFFWKFRKWTVKWTVDELPQWHKKPMAKKSPYLANRHGTSVVNSMQQKKAFLHEPS